MLGYSFRAIPPLGALSGNSDASDGWVVLVQSPDGIRVAVRLALVSDALGREDGATISAYLVDLFRPGWESVARIIPDRVSGAGEILHGFDLSRTTRDGHSWNVEALMTSTPDAVLSWEDTVLMLNDMHHALAVSEDTAHV